VGGKLPPWLKARILKAPRWGRAGGPGPALPPRLLGGLIAGEIHLTTNTGQGALPMTFSVVLPMRSFSKPVRP
jgi:hypothetical protein